MNSASGERPPVDNRDEDEVCNNEYFVSSK